MKYHRLATGLTILFGSQTLAGVQADLPPDEFRVVTRPYEPPQQPLRVQTELVLVRVVVRDKSGAAIRGLKQTDFEIRDNGQPQRLSVFAEESAPAPTRQAAQNGSAPPPVTADPAPASARARYIGLYFDDRNLPLSDIVYARQAAESFVQKDLRVGDRIAIMTTSGQVMQDFTADTKQILEKLAQLRTQVRASASAGSCPRIKVLHAFQVVRMNDRQALDLGIAMARTCPVYQFTSDRDLAAIVQRQSDYVLSLTENYTQDTMAHLTRAVEIMGRMPGERVLLLASSGFWSKSLQREQDRISDLAIRREVVINSLDAKGLATDNPDVSEGPPVYIARRPDLQMAADRYLRDQRFAFNDPLAGLALATGGRFFQNSNDLQMGLRQLVAPPDVAYLIGFEPQSLKSDGRFHKIDVKVAAAQPVTLRHRPGYYAPTRAEAAGRERGDPFEAAISGKETPVGLSFDVRQEKQPAEGSTTLRITLSIQLRELPFQERLSRHVQRFRYAAAVFDATGKFLAGQQATIYVSLKEANFARLQRDGLEQKLSMQLPPGNYVVRHVVQEAVEGRIAATSRAVAIP